jgi:hypothetical protein
MPDALVYCTRNINGEERSLIEALGKAISPDNITPRATSIQQAGSSFLAAYDAHESSVRNNEVLFGHTFNYNGLDGAFASFRISDRAVTLQTDCLASKTIWYYLGKDIFVASTSQRAIIMLKGMFTFNSNAAYLFLNTGVLGNGMSWDRDILSVDKKSTLTFNPRQWELQIDTAPNPPFAKKYASGEEQYRSLKDTLEYIFDNFHIDFASTQLPISGGYDSRNILLSLLKRGVSIETITWGHPSSLNDPENDAAVASTLTKALGVPNTFYESFMSSESLEARLSRFIRMGEGRIENINAYLDGFTLWKSLRDNGTTSIIRGDEFFGWSSVVTDKDVLNSCALLYGDAFANHSLLDGMVMNHTLSMQGYGKHIGESQAEWRDRLYQDYMVPNFYAALNYIKQKYVDVFTPYYSAGLLKTIRQFSDRNRTNKKLFKAIVNNTYSGVPYAKKPANIQFGEILSRDEFKEIIDEKLVKLQQNPYLDGNAIDKVRTHYLRPPSDSTKSRFEVGKLLPEVIKSMIKRSGFYTQHYYLDNKQVALRLLILQLAQEMFEEDSRQRVAVA